MKLEDERINNFTKVIPGLIAARDYDEIARLGVRHGVAYLQEEISRGKTEDEARFAAEVYAYKDGALVLVTVVVGNDDRIQKALLKISREKLPDALLLIYSAFASRSASNQPASTREDRETIAVAKVYLGQSTKAVATESFSITKTPGYTRIQ
jgi:hypothetical protein